MALGTVYPQWSGLLHIVAVRTVHPRGIATVPAATWNSAVSLGGSLHRTGIMAGNSDSSLHLGRSGLLVIIDQSEFLGSLIPGSGKNARH